MRKGLWILIATFITISIPVGFYYWVQHNIGALDNLNCFETYIPWNFHLTVWMCFTLIWLGLVFIINSSGEQEHEIHLSPMEYQDIRAFLEEFQSWRRSRASKPKPKQKKKPAEKPAAKPKKQTKQPGVPESWATEKFE